MINMPLSAKTAPIRAFLAFLWGKKNLGFIFVRPYVIEKVRLTLQNTSRDF